MRCIHNGNKQWQQLYKEKGPKRKQVNKIETILNVNKRYTVHLYNTSIATIMVNNLNSAKNLRLKHNPLHVLVDSGSNESFVNKRQITYIKQTKIVNITTWITKVGAIKTKRNVKVKCKLDGFSTTK